jgi:hypothetical protein
MRLQFGPHKGRTTETLLLRVPDYAWWMLQHSPTSRLASDFARLAAVFDRKPFTTNCQSCGQDATHASAYAGSADLHPLCDECRIYDPGYVPLGFTADVRTFHAAVRHAENSSPRRRRRNVRAIVRNLARAKGSPRRVTEQSAQAFFERNS